MNGWGFVAFGLVMTSISVLLAVNHWRRWGEHSKTLWGFVGLQVALLGFQIFLRLI